MAESFQTYKIEEIPNIGVHFEGDISEKYRSWKANETHDYSDLDSLSASEECGHDPHYPYQSNVHPTWHTSYSNSSRESSGSYKPMLTNASVPFHRRKRSIDHQLLSRRRRYVQYLCWTVAFTLLLFAAFLWRASYLSRQHVELGRDNKFNPPKPPPWLDFPLLTRYYGGVRSVVSETAYVPEYPGDRSSENDTAEADEQSNEYHTESKLFPFDPYEKSSTNTRARVDCFLDEANTVKIPRVRFHQGIPQGMPENIIGSHEAIGLSNNICFDRFGRLAPYGLGYSLHRGGSGAGLDGDRQGTEDLWNQSEGGFEVDYRKVKWAQAQTSCLRRNKARFRISDSSPGAYEQLFTSMATADGKAFRRTDEPHAKRSLEDTETPKNPAGLNQTLELLPRSVIILRTWWDHIYSTEDIIYLRSLISELCILSGGEYTVHFLIHVKDDTLPIWADKKIYDRILENSLPEEFRGMGTLWSERQMSLIYSGLQESFFRDLPVHGVYRGLYLALQYFSNQHPEYDFLWNWEMDVRYTGHWYDLFNRVSTWSKDQARKGLWERNGRFYVPSVHGTWEDFKQMVRVQTEMGTQVDNENDHVWSGLHAGAADVPGSSRAHAERPIWGSFGPEDMLSDQDDPQAPSANSDKDHYTWGVGEDADFITFSPLFDPDGTTWFYNEDITGYNTSAPPPPRRANIGTSSRLSRRLLQTMHREMILSRHHMFTEMWPASIALHHGLKAVYVPHPVYVDRRWPEGYLAGVMNGGRNGASGGARTSVYGGREHNFKGQTWFYDAEFASNLWRRWLGYKVDGQGGEQAEMAGEGRMCLPAMLLHPVKNIAMVVQGRAGDEASPSAED